MEKGNLIRAPHIRRDIAIRQHFNNIRRIAAVAMTWQ